ncbi:hypothetical protein Bca4012_067012 [Brassica carinata]|uniref:Uncharacterized protein n=1 Tax=Brassica carinata TaxID=52824 RepID=A0A8X7VR64_BRACI|nr:hypothetical protein Bca52824_019321 [Brassica carinata]
MNFVVDPLCLKKHTIEIRRRFLFPKISDVNRTVFDSSASSSSSQFIFSLHSPSWPAPAPPGSTVYPQPIGPVPAVDGGYLQYQVFRNLSVTTECNFCISQPMSPVREAAVAEFLNAVVGRVGCSHYQPGNRMELQWADGKHVDRASKWLCCCWDDIPNPFSVVVSRPNALSTISAPPPLYVLCVISEAAEDLNQPITDWREISAIAEANS